MSILDRIRALFSGEEIPEEAAQIYRLSKDEGDALSRLEAERRRADRHRAVLRDDIRALAGEEERLVAEGRQASSGVERRLLAGQIVEVRSRVDDLLNRVDILTRRISVFDRQAALLRDRAVLEAPLPDREEISKRAEDALVARREFEEVADLAELHGDVSRLAARSGETEVLQELGEPDDESVSLDEMIRREEVRRGRVPRGLADEAG